MISCKIFFQLRVTVFKEKLNLYLPLIFYSSLAFISEQIAEKRFGALLGLVTNLLPSLMFLATQFRLKTVWKISKPYCMTLKTVAR